MMHNQGYCATIHVTLTRVCPVSFALIIVQLMISQRKSKEISTGINFASTIGSGRSARIARAAPSASMTGEGLNGLNSRTSGECPVIILQEYARICKNNDSVRFLITQNNLDYSGLLFGLFLITKTKMDYSFGLFLITKTKHGLF